MTFFVQKHHSTDKKCHSEHETFVLVESIATPKCVMLFLVSTSELCPQSPSEALLHVCLQSNCKNIFSILFFKVYFAPPYHKTLSAPSFHVYVLQWGTVCVKLFHRQTSISQSQTLILISIQLLICCMLAAFSLETANH